MICRSASRRLMAGALTTAAIGGALLGLSGTAAASPVPSIPLTTAEMCASGGGQVTSPAPGVQRCSGGGDTGDFIISEEQAEQLSRTVPRPPFQTPPLPG